jgi:hypothetical protein
MYDMSMSMTSHKDTVQEDGVDKEAYVVSFTNGAYKELEELQRKLKLKDVDTVLKVAVAVLKRIPEPEDGDGQPTDAVDI